MSQSHPHADATYRVIQNPDMSFGAEVNIPGQRLATVTGFATEALAEAWISKHKREINDYQPYSGWHGHLKKTPLRFDDNHSVAVDERADDIVKKIDKAL